MVLPVPQLEFIKLNYYLNPIVECKWPSTQDAFPTDWPHDIWHTPDASDLDFNCSLRRSDLVTWFREHKTEIFDSDSDLDIIGNFVRINLWSHHIRANGIVKPILLHDINGKLEVGVGGSRLLAIESYRSEVRIPAFISCLRSQSVHYRHTTLVRDFDNFAKICQAEPMDVFLFRWSDPKAPFSLDWYEHDTGRTRWITPDMQTCADLFRNYLKTSNHDIDYAWFDLHIDWSVYGS